MCKEKCPNCFQSLNGPLIPEEKRHLYGGKKHSRKEIAFYSRELGRTLFWICTKCEKGWNRFSPEDGKIYQIAQNTMYKLGYLAPKETK